MSKFPCISCLPALLGALLVLACGDGKSNQSSSIAKAFEHVADPSKNAEEAGDQMRKLKEKVEKDREAAIAAEIDRAASVPATLAADIKTGCAEMRAAYDGFVSKRLAGDGAELERWKVMKGVDLDPAVGLRGQRVPRGGAERGPRARARADRRVRQEDRRADARRHGRRQGSQEAGVSGRREPVA